MYLKQFLTSSLAFIAASFSAFAVINSGSIDTSFQPGSINDAVTAIVLQPDQKIIIGGSFTSVNGVSRNRIARLMSDGSVDTSFNPGTGANGPVYSVALQSDGKVLMCGQFSSVNGVARNYYARLNVDGGLDTTFAPPASAIITYYINPLYMRIHALAGGKSILSGFYFASISPFYTRNGLVRLNDNGTVDTSFNPPGNLAGVYASLVQGDGKIIVGGLSTNIYTNIIRLTAAGALDSTFNGTGVTNNVTGITQLPGGGYFLQAGSKAIWLQNNGSINSGATTTTGAGGFNILGAIAQSDGRVIICGDFSEINGATHLRIVRLNPNGSTDTTFDPGVGPSTSPYALAIQNDGKVLVGGAFSTFNNSLPGHLTRLNNTIAGPPDVTVPTITVATAIPPTTTSGTLLVQGTASDNVGVVQVLYRIGTDAFTPVSSGLASLSSATINWNVTLNLKAGTNVIQFKCVDAAGNESAVFSKTTFYSLRIPIGISINGGGGTISITNGSPLELGKTYTVTAKPNVGFKLDHWLANIPITALFSPSFAGEIVGTNISLNFVMKSNLFIQATFKDIQAPTVTITSPPAATTTNPAPITVQGKASDNGSLSGVVYRVNGGALQLASSTNGWTNWTFNILLTPGTNVVEVQSIDGAGNRSAFASRVFFYSTKSTLTLTAGFGGKILAPKGTNNLEVGRGYTITAMPTNKSMIFYDWSQDSTQRTAVLNFIMKSNMMLQANFITNPFTAIKGTYNGLFFEIADVNFGRSGLITFTLTDKGTASGKILEGADSLSFSTQFDGHREASFVLKRAGKPDQSVFLQLPSPPPGIPNFPKGFIGQIWASNWFASANGYRNYAEETTNNCPFLGSYNFTIEGGGLPGPGIASVVVDKKGVLKMNGFLADGTAISQTISTAQNGFWPLFLPLNKNGGQLFGWLFFGSFPGPLAIGPAPRIIWGQLDWQKPAQLKAIYPNGFTNTFLVSGTEYTPPAAGAKAINWSPTILNLIGGNLTNPIVSVGTLDIANKFTFSPNSNKLSANILPATGNLSPTSMFFHPAKKANTRIYGVVMPNQNQIRGFFLGTNESGSVLFTPND